MPTPEFIQARERATKQVDQEGLEGAERDDRILDLTMEFVRSGEPPAKPEADVLEELAAPVAPVSIPQGPRSGGRRFGPAPVALAPAADPDLEELAVKVSPGEFSKRMGLDGPLSPEQRAKIDEKLRTDGRSRQDQIADRFAAEKITPKPNLGDNPPDLGVEMFDTVRAMERRVEKERPDTTRRQMRTEVLKELRKAGVVSGMGDEELPDTWWEAFSKAYSPKLVGSGWREQVAGLLTGSTTPDWNAPYGSNKTEEQRIRSLEKPEEIKRAAGEFVRGLLPELRDVWAESAMSSDPSKASQRPVTRRALERSLGYETEPSASEAAAKIMEAVSTSDVETGGTLVQAESPVGYGLRMMMGVSAPFTQAVADFGSRSIEAAGGPTREQYKKVVGQDWKLGTDDYLSKLSGADWVAGVLERTAEGRGFTQDIPAYAVLGGAEPGSPRHTAAKFGGVIADMGLDPTIPAVTAGIGRGAKALESALAGTRAAPSGAKLSASLEAGARGIAGADVVDVADGVGGLAASKVLKGEDPSAGYSAAQWRRVDEMYDADMVSSEPAAPAAKTAPDAGAPQAAAPDNAAAAVPSAPPGPPSLAMRIATMEDEIASAERVARAMPPETRAGAIEKITMEKERLSLLRQELRQEIRKQLQDSDPALAAKRLEEETAKAEKLAASEARKGMREAVKQVNDAIKKRAQDAAAGTREMGLAKAFEEKRAASAARAEKKGIRDAVQEVNDKIRERQKEAAQIRRDAAASKGAEEMRAAAAAREEQRGLRDASRDINKTIRQREREAAAGTREMERAKAVKEKAVPKVEKAKPAARAAKDAGTPSPAVKAVEDAVDEGRLSKAEGDAILQARAEDALSPEVKSALDEGTLTAKADDVDDLLDFGAPVRSEALSPDAVPPMPEPLRKELGFNPRKGELEIRNNLDRKDQLRQLVMEDAYDRAVKLGKERAQQAADLLYDAWYRKEFKHPLDNPAVVKQLPEWMRAAVKERVAGTVPFDGAAKSAKPGPKARATGTAAEEFAYQMSTIDGVKPHDLMRETGLLPQGKTWEEWFTGKPKNQAGAGSPELRALEPNLPDGPGQLKYHIENSAARMRSKTPVTLEVAVDQMIKRGVPGDTVVVSGSNRHVAEWGKGGIGGPNRVGASRIEAEYIRAKLKDKQVTLSEPVAGTRGRRGSVISPKALVDELSKMLPQRLQRMTPADVQSLAARPSITVRGKAYRPDSLVKAMREAAAAELRATVGSEKLVFLPGTRGVAVTPEEAARLQGALDSRLASEAIGPATMNSPIKGKFDLSARQLGGLNAMRSEAGLAPLADAAVSTAEYNASIGAWLESRAGASARARHAARRVPLLTQAFGGALNDMKNWPVVGRVANLNMEPFVSGLETYAAKLSPGNAVAVREAAARLRSVGDVVRREVRDAIKSGAVDPSVVVHASIQDAFEQLPTSRQATMAREIQDSTIKPTTAEADAAASDLLEAGARAGVSPSERALLASADPLDRYKGLLQWSKRADTNLREFTAKWVQSHAMGGTALSGERMTIDLAKAIVDEAGIDKVYNSMLSGDLTTAPFEQAMKSRWGGVPTDASTAVTTLAVLMRQQQELNRIIPVLLERGLALPEGHGLSPMLRDIASGQIYDTAGRHKYAGDPMFQQAIREADRMGYDIGRVSAFEPSTEVMVGGQKVFLHPELAKIIKDSQYLPGGGSAANQSLALRALDKANNFFRMATTFVWPAKIFNDVVGNDLYRLADMGAGDAMKNALANVKNKQLISAMVHDDMSSVGQSAYRFMKDDGTLGPIAGPSVDGVVLRTPNAVYTGEDILRMARELRVGRNSYASQLTNDIASQLRGAQGKMAFLKESPEKLMEAVQDVAGSTEAFMKHGRFLYELERGATPAVAAEKARNMLLNYERLNPRMKQIMTRFIPFYAFHATNLQKYVKLAVENPQRFMATAKFFEQQPYLWGIQTEGFRDDDWGRIVFGVKTDPMTGQKYVYSSAPQGLAPAIKLVTDIGRVLSSRGGDLVTSPEVAEPYLGLPTSIPIAIFAGRAPGREYVSPNDLTIPEWMMSAPGSELYKYAFGAKLVKLGENEPLKRAQYRDSNGVGYAWRAGGNALTDDEAKQFASKWLMFKAVGFGRGIGEIDKPYQAYQKLTGVPGGTDLPASDDVASFLGLPAREVPTLGPEMAKQEQLLKSIKSKANQFTDRAISEPAE